VSPVPATPSDLACPNLPPLLLSRTPLLNQDLIPLAHFLIQFKIGYSSTMTSYQPYLYSVMTNPLRL